MTITEMKLKTPRGTFNIHTIFDSEQEAKENGWGLWFTHIEESAEWYIYTKDNRVGAVVRQSIRIATLIDS